ncbi:hypothetical protein VMCG_02165 [Cytospora schulzeri]|uniref:Peptidase M20 dimerisation domain-containing protein n=1 Tax=Cytospora schulzeri TaxID=448051 RepID=A0A423X1V0_9PEZI|nr:hypothetical protein VMCG_02165 [Valsa malicola]
MQELPGNDPAWDHMFAFSEYLNATFPLIRQSVALERVNTHGLVYTWHGKNQSLKPTLLLAHQDVVPVQQGTEDIWEHPPFSGDFDGTYIWGRGSIDSKSSLIASIEAVEELLRVGFTPERTIILAFGFDEEISGYQGAKQIALHLIDRYGEDGIAALIDEGPGMEQKSITDSIYAVPGLAEKGYFDAEVVVHMKSGHSLLPPNDNSITVMADLVRKIKETPFEFLVDRTSPVLDAVFCLAQHDEMFPGYGRGIVEKVDKNVTIIKDHLTMIAALAPSFMPLFQTTQSQAMIHGGVKVNLIPAKTSLRINHRIVHGNTISDVKNHLEEVVKAFIAEFNGNTDVEHDMLRFNGWDQREVLNSIGLRALPGSTEPSPITPSSVDGTTPYRILQGTTKALYRDKVAVIAPMLMPGSTDSRHYGNVTKHIFRFSPGHDIGDSTDNQIKSHSHGVNERASMRGHVNGVKWYSLFIRNMDEADMD